MPTHDINGYSFEYQERGSGAPVIFVHGSNGDYRTWQAQQAQFADTFRTIAYSRRYHWPNEQIADGVDYSMTEQLDDLQQILESVVGEPVHFVGHSYGAYLGLLLAMREPRLMRTLTLAEPPVIPLFVTIPPKPPELLKLLATRPRTGIAIVRFAVKGANPATEAAKRDDAETAIQHFGTAVLGRDRFNRLSEARMEQVRANYIKAEFLGSGLTPLDAAEVSRIQIPTLLVNGAESPRLFHHLNDRLQELLPRAERAAIPDASHIMHEDNTPAYNSAVLSFLERH